MATGLVLGLLTAAPCANGSDFFPIGLYEAGIFPTQRRPTWDCQGHSIPDPNADTLYNAREWSQLDEIGGDRLSGDAYGYRSGFNVVQDYFYLSEEGAWSLETVKDWLRAARDRGFRAMVCLPVIENANIQQVSLPSRRSFFQRTPPDYSRATSLMNSLTSDATIASTIYGWYLVDEPINIYRPARCVEANGDTIAEGFHTQVVSALRLRAAYDTLRLTVDNTRPYVVTLPDYSDPLFDSAWCPRPANDYWRWDNPGCAPETTTYASFPDPCHSTAPRIELTQDYSECADVIQNDSYLNAGYGIAEQNILWQLRLHQLDEIGVKSEAQILISCALGCSLNGVPPFSGPVIMTGRPSCQG